MSKKSHYILHRGSTRQKEKEAKKRKVPKEVTFDVAHWILDKGVETQVIKKSTRIKKIPEFFYKFIQVFTSMRIAPTREALHDHARKMKKNNKEEEEKNNEEEEEEEKNNEEEEAKVISRAAPPCRPAAKNLRARILILLKLLAKV